MKILNVKTLNIGELEDLLLFCRERLSGNSGAFLIPMNPIKVTKARKSHEFQRIIETADWVFPDGWGLKWAASFLYGQEIPLIPGYRVMFSLLEQAARNNHSIYLLGTTEEILDTATKELHQQYPALRIVGTHHGFLAEADEKRLFQEIAKIEPHYVFVGMGEYRQERVIQRLKSVYPSAIYLGVGGAIDLVAGKQPTPPAWIRNNHLEWLFRLFRQPFRAPRFKALPVFVFLIVMEKILSFLRQWLEPTKNANPT